MEHWRPVSNYEGLYEVSDLGNVRSITRTVTQVSKTGKVYSRVMQGKCIAGFIGSSGRYRFVHLADRTFKLFSVHSLVLKAFIGEPAPDQEGCHKDGNNLNNCLYNLRWDTHKANEEDRKKHGTVPRGDVHSCTKIPDTQVQKIKRDLMAYEGKHYGKCVAIAALHGVSAKYVGEINRGTKRKSV